MTQRRPAVPAHLARGIRFAGVGVVNTGVYYVFYLLLRMRVTYLTAHVLAFVVAMIVSYFLNCFVTFRTTPRWRTFLLYPLSNVANFVIITVGLQLAVRTFHIDQRIAPLLAALVALPVTYVVAHAVMRERTRHGTGVKIVPPVSRTTDAGARGTAEPRE